MKPTNLPMLVQECEMDIVGHKIFVRLKDIPMYLSNKTKDSIRNRYSHSIEVGMSTEYLLFSLGQQLGHDIDFNFFGLGKIVGLLHDIGHTAYSHDGETILDKLLRKASKDLANPIHFNANLNNFRRIEKYGFFEKMPMDMKQYALASLLKRKRELAEYPEYGYIADYVDSAIELENTYFEQMGLGIRNTTSKTILCQAMDIADENRYRVTDIIDVLNIYSQKKLVKILAEMVKSDVRIKSLRKYVTLRSLVLEGYEEKHYDTLKVKEVLIALLNKQSNAKTEFQNLMNSISMAFNRNFSLRDDGKIVPRDDEIEQLRKEFESIAAKYIWGSKKVRNIKAPFRHQFSTVAKYFIKEPYNLELIDSNSYKNTLQGLRDSTLTNRSKELYHIRNFLGGLTNQKIVELYKRIELERFEHTHTFSIESPQKLLEGTSVKQFERKLEKYAKRVGKI